MNFTHETIANLTPEEFATRYEAFVVLAHGELETVKALAQDETFNQVTNIDLWDRRSVESDSIYDRDMEDVIEIINEFKEEIKEFEDLRGFCIENYEEIDGDYEDSYAEIGSIGYRASWIVPKEELSDNPINSNFLEFVRNWLAPEGTAGYNVNYVDCKLLTLFKEGKIDWNTLRTLVYSNCSV